MILSLQNTLSETQAQSRLAVLRQECLGQVRAARPSGPGTSWHRPAYPQSCLQLPSLSLFPIFGGTAGFDLKPACRMHAASLFAAPVAPPVAPPASARSARTARTAFGDTSVNAVNAQEGSP